MNQQTNMAADAAAGLVQQIATTLYGEAGAGVTDLIGLANLVQAKTGYPVSASMPLEAMAKRKLAQLQGDGFIVNGVAIFNQESGKRGLVDHLGYVGWVGQPMGAEQLQLLLDGWKQSDYPFSYEGQHAQRALNACISDLEGVINGQAVANG